MKTLAFNGGFLPQNSWIINGNAKIEGNTIAFEGSATACQTIVLNHKNPAVILCECESRAENATGNNAYEYSFLIEAQFADGTTNKLAWVPFNDGTLFHAEYAPFPDGTTQWNKRTLTLAFKKPVRSINFVLMFRNYSGKAFFRNAAVRDLSKIPTFDAMPICDIPQTIKEHSLLLRDCAQDEFKELIPDSDSMTETPFSAFGIKAEISVREQSRRHSIFHIKLVSDGTRNRAITFYAAIRNSSPATVYTNMTDVFQPSENSTVIDAAPWRIGANSLLSRSPFISVDDGANEIISMGFSPLYPLPGRAGYSQALSSSYIAFDTALTNEQPSAEFEYVIFASKAEYKFRGALEKYIQIFPDHHANRVKEQGLWMPFLPISKIPDYEDFHFRFKEGADEPEWDRNHNMLTFRYTEPLTLWMNTGGEKAASRAELDYFREHSAPEHQRQILASSVMCGETGTDTAILMDRPWCRGAVWSINSMPGLEGEVTDYKTKWNSKIAEKYHSVNSKDNLSGGEYIDSAEGYATAEADFNKNHFKAAKLPLTFATDSLKPCIAKGTIVYEYINSLRTEMRSRGKYMMGNGTPGAMWFLTPLLDVAGIETDWCVDGKYTPVTLEELCQRRSASAAKPYCFLMNTDFGRFTFEMVEKYMARCMAFGIFPGFFSANAATGHYFAQKELYERDRPLFKKYLPAITRIAESGWESVTHAETDEKDIHLERFGESIITVLNDSGRTTDAKITIFLPHAAEAKDMITNTLYKFDGDTITLTLAPDETKALEF